MTTDQSRAKYRHLQVPNIKSIENPRMRLICGILSINAKNGWHNTFTFGIELPYDGFKL